MNSLEEEAELKMSVKVVMHWKTERINDVIGDSSVRRGHLPG